MKRYVGIFYNNNGTAAFKPIVAQDSAEAYEVAEALAKEMEVCSGGTQFVVTVLTVVQLIDIAENATREPRPYIIDDIT